MTGTIFWPARRSALLPTFRHATPNACRAGVWRAKVSEKNVRVKAPNRLWRVTTTVDTARFAKLFRFCIENESRLTSSADAFRRNNVCCIAWDGQISSQTLSFGNKLKDIRKNLCISGVLFPFDRCLNIFKCS